MGLKKIWNSFEENKMLSCMTKEDMPATLYRLFKETYWLCGIDSDKLISMIG